MIIISKNKDKIVNLNGVASVRLNEYGKEIYAMTPTGMIERLGEYEEEIVARKVFDLIIHAILSNAKIFEMPE